MWSSGQSWGGGSREWCTPLPVLVPAALKIGSNGTHVLHVVKYCVPMFIPGVKQNRVTVMTKIPPSLSLSVYTYTLENSNTSFNREAVCRRFVVWL